MRDFIYPRRPANWPYDMNCRVDGWLRKTGIVV